MVLIKRFVFIGFLYLQYFFYSLRKKGPFGDRRPFFIDEVDIKNSNSLKRSLIKNQVKQYNEASCSVATMATIINGVKNLGNDSASINVNQKDIPENIKTANWKERMSGKGDNGKRGLPLNLLGEVVKSSLQFYGIGYEKIDVVTIDSGSKADELRSRLIEFEENGRALIIAHFNQGLCFQTLQIPHISPVGGYDRKRDKVLILDVDFSVKKNYEVDFETFYESLLSNYNNFFKRYGYGHGGYIYIKLGSEGDK